LKQGYLQNPNKWFEERWTAEIPDFFLEIRSLRNRIFEMGNTNAASSPIRFPNNILLPLLAPFLKSLPVSFPPFFICLPIFF